MSLFVKLAMSAAPKERKSHPQDMERKKQRMREYYQNNRDMLLERAKARSKARYAALKRQKEYCS